MRFPRCTRVHIRCARLLPRLRRFLLDFFPPAPPVSAPSPSSRPSLSTRKRLNCLANCFRVKENPRCIATETSSTAFATSSPVDRTNAFNCLSIFTTRRRARLFAGDSGGGFVVTGVSAFAAFGVVVAIAGRCDEEFTTNQSKIALSWKEVVEFVWTSRTVSFVINNKGCYVRIDR